MINNLIKRNEWSSIPPHFHAEYGEYNCCITIDDIELLTGSMPNKQLKMLFGWAALHQEELKEEWYLAQLQKELFAIEPLK
ncbi:DUF4160 domain-containing protein [Clostridium magnum]|uniref:DUF4160 domain-containing protein n=1 Tax=Clostridium magnum TaxID=33954 RepID=UPI001FA6ABDA|nr:DUF4160 domain-containing protein [Clostridium magnum]